MTLCVFAQTPIKFHITPSQQLFYFVRIDSNLPTSGLSDTTRQCVYVQRLGGMFDDACGDLVASTDINVNDILVPAETNISVVPNVWNAFSICIDVGYHNATSAVFSVACEYVPMLVQRVFVVFDDPDRLVAAWTIRGCRNVTIRAIRVPMWILWPDMLPEFVDDATAIVEHAVSPLSRTILLLGPSKPYINISLVPWTDECATNTSARPDPTQPNNGGEDTQPRDTDQSTLILFICTGTVVNLMYMLGIAFGVWKRYHSLNILASALNNSLQLPFAFFYAKREWLYVFTVAVAAVLMAVVMWIKIAVQCMKAGAKHAKWLPSHERWELVVTAFAYALLVCVFNASVLRLQ